MLSTTCSSTSLSPRSCNVQRARPSAAATGRPASSSSRLAGAVEKCASSGSSWALRSSAASQAVDERTACGPARPSPCRCRGRRRCPHRCVRRPRDPGRPAGADGARLRRSADPFPPSTISRRKRRSSSRPVPRDGSFCLIQPLTLASPQARRARVGPRRRNPGREAPCPRGTRLAVSLLSGRIST